MLGMSQYTDEIEKRQRDYSPGDRIRLVAWEPHPIIDDEETVPPGTTGTVTFVDAIGTVFANWDNGSRLGATIADDIRLEDSDA